MKVHIHTITDLLLGAAYADKRLEGAEMAAISSLLCKLVGEPSLPAAQSERIKAFNPAKFDATAAAARLVHLSLDDKRRVLELIAAVSESDDVIDLAEDAYLRRVAAGLGLPDAEIGAFTVDILEPEELEGLLKP